MQPVVCSVDSVRQSSCTLILRTGYTQDHPARSVSFWLFAGQCKSVADHQKLLYVFGSKVVICVGYEFD